MVVINIIQSGAKLYARPLGTKLGRLLFWDHFGNQNRSEDHTVWGPPISGTPDLHKNNMGTPFVDPPPYLGTCPLHTHMQSYHRYNRDYLYSLEAFCVLCHCILIFKMGSPFFKFQGWGPYNYVCDTRLGELNLLWQRGGWQRGGRFSNVNQTYNIYRLKAELVGGSILKHFPSYAIICQLPVQLLLYFLPLEVWEISYFLSNILHNTMRRCALFGRLGNQGNCLR